MRRMMILMAGFALAMGVMMTSPQQGSFGLTVPSVHAEGMADVQLILKKLRESMSSMKDFEALEDAGMDIEDVNRLRRAMKSKIKQMTGDAVDLIRAL